MRYWFGYLTAGIFAAITWLLTRFGERYATLVDMVYPYVVRTLQEYLANWTGQFPYPVWQALAVVLGMLILASLVLVLVLKWNPIQWLGWVLAVFSGIYLLHMALWGMNYYAGSLSDDIRLEVSSYNLDELTEATEYYRDKANSLAKRVSRDGSGNVKFDSFEALAEKARGRLSHPDLRKALSCLCRVYASREKAGLGGHVHLHGHYRLHLRHHRRGLRESPDSGCAAALYHVPRNGA